MAAYGWLDVWLLRFLYGWRKLLVMNISKSIVAAITANGWESSTWGGDLIAKRGREELAISGGSSTYARYFGPAYDGVYEDQGVVEGVRKIVAVLATVAA